MAFVCWAMCFTSAGGKKTLLVICVSTPLNVPLQLFDRLKLQETLVKKGTDSKVATDLPTLGQKSGLGWRRTEEECGVKKHSSKERTRSSSLPRTSGKELALPGGTSQTEGTTSARGTRGRSQKKRRPKVDYQQVFTRHINQIFIRGENVLLVHLAH